MKLPWFILLFSGEIFVNSLNCNEKKIEERDIKYWIANPSNIIDPITNSCKPEFMENISKNSKYISTIGPTLWTVSVLNSSASEVISDMSPQLWNCFADIREKFPNINIAANGFIGECWDNNCVAKVMGRNPIMFINSLIKFVQNYNIDEIWFDFETKNLNSNDTFNLNYLFNLLSQQLTVYRYAGCVHNGEPAYLNETCKQFVQGAPLVGIQGAGTYWDNSPSGFNKLLLDMISDIGNDNIHLLSVAVCPDCSHYDQITQKELYERMDLLCNLNITSISAFTFDEILELTGNGGTGQRWLNSFKYYKTGEII